MTQGRTLSNFILLALIMGLIGIVFSGCANHEKMMSLEKQINQVEQKANKAIQKAESLQTNSKEYAKKAKTNSAKAKQSALQSKEAAKSAKVSVQGLRGLNAYLPRAQLSVLIGWHMSVTRFSKGLCQNKTENYS